VKLSLSNFHKKDMKNYSPQFGFTLIEIVIVIVILSILGVGSVQFISFSAQGYVDTVRRSELSSTATIVNEKMTRLLRDALPNSVRITSDNRCIEFIPIIGASRYTQAAFPGSPSGVSQNTVHMVPLDNVLSSNGYLTIFPMSSQINSLYSGSDNPGFISLETVSFTSTVSGASVYTFNNSGSFVFQQRSPNQRVFFTSSPVAFCQSGTELFYYRNYGFIPNISNLVTNLASTVPNRLLIADKLLANSLIFSYLPSSLRRNAIVAYELELQDSSKITETLVVNQEVQIRNVP
jgi:MSHA biogenesis protein MshO